MNSVVSLIASYVFNALWQIPFLVLTGWLICRLLRRLGPMIEHRVWVAILFTSIVLPAGQALRLLPIRQTESSSHVSTSGHLLTLQTIGIDQNSLLVVPSLVITAAAVLYLAAWIFFLFRFVTSILSTVDLVKRSRPCFLGPAFLKPWHEAERFADVSETQILTSSSIPGPMTLWLWGPILLLPEYFNEDTSVQDFHVAVAHESTHIRRQDYLKNLSYEAVSLFIAFHPATWLIKAQIAQTREMACDAVAVEIVGEARIYVQSLLRLAVAIASCPPATTSHAIGIFDANILEKRIMTIRAKKVTTSAAMRYSLVFVGSLLLFLAVGGGAAAAVGLSSENSSSTTSALTNDHIYMIGKDVSAPVLIKAPTPEYPSSSPKNSTFSGSCTVGLVVDTSGEPREVHVLRSLSKEFDDKAIEAVDQYRFKPAKRNGKAVPVAMQVEVHFQSF